MQNNAKNNAKIMQNNAGACPPRAESGAAYPLYFSDLRLDIGSRAGFEKIPVLLG
jgi:hypothetical protein